MKQRVVKKAKETEWRKYCQSVSAKTPMNDLQNKIKTIKGYKKSGNIPTLKFPTVDISD